MELAELQRAMQQNTKATQALGGYDEELARARALRDSPGNASIDKYGAVSPFAVLSDVIDNSRARKNIRETTPLRQSASDDIASSASQLEGNKLRLSLEKVAREEEKQRDDLLTSGQSRLLKTNEALRAKEKQTDDLLTSKQSREIEREERDYDAETLSNSVTFSNGEDEINVVSKNGKPMWLDEGKLKEIPRGYVELDNSQYQTSLSNSALKDIKDETNLIRKFNGIVEDYDPRFNQVGGYLTKPLQSIIKTASTNDLLKFAGDETMTKDARDAAQWWANFKMEYELPRRHKIFGATLTNNEQSSWADAVNVMRELPAGELKKRLKKLQRNLSEDFASNMSMTSMSYGGNKNVQNVVAYATDGTGLKFDNKTSSWKYVDSDILKDDTDTNEEPALTDRHFELAQRITGQEKVLFDQLSPENQFLYLDGQLGD